MCEYNGDLIVDKTLVPSALTRWFPLLGNGLPHGSKRVILTQFFCFEWLYHSTRFSAKGTVITVTHFDTTHLPIPQVEFAKLAHMGACLALHPAMFC